MHGIDEKVELEIIEREKYQEFNAVLQAYGLHPWGVGLFFSL